MPAKNNKTLNRINQSSKKINSTHVHQRMHEKKINNLSGGEWKPTTEKLKLKLEIINNLPSGQRESLQRCDQRWEMQRDEKRDKKETNEINKPWSHPRAKKKSIEVRSPKTISWKPRRAETIDGKPTTRTKTSMTTNLWPSATRCSL